MDHLKYVDPEIAAAIAHEWSRQSRTLELIASENITSRAVMAAQGSVMTNKYAEGYPGRRYYGGCEAVDMAETLAVDRAKRLFGAEFANVQPHSGSQANAAVYMSYLELGDTVLGMDLACGGHLTHGSPVSFSGKFYNFIHYGVERETGLIDYDQMAALAKEHKPKLIVAGASAYPRFIDFDRCAEIAREVGAALFVDMAHIAGLVAAGCHPSPVPVADVVTSTTHKTLRGPRGGLVLSRDEEIGKKINSSIFPGLQGGPLMHVVAAKAVAFKEALTPAFNEYQRQVVANCARLGEKLMSEGVDLVSGGTDNHMALIDLSKLDVTGLDAEQLLEEAGITTNKNAIPFDREGPKVTSGIRVGTAAVTSRGMGLDEMDKIGEWIAGVVKNPTDKAGIESIRWNVYELCDAFPLYPVKG